MPRVRRADRLRVLGDDGLEGRQLGLGLPGRGVEAPQVDDRALAQVEDEIVPDRRGRLVPKGNPGFLLKSPLLHAEDPSPTFSLGGQKVHVT